jgi:NADH-quinone oxidoreductase subunit L
MTKLSFAWVVKTFKSLTPGNYFEEVLFTWMQVGGFTLPIAFRFDQLTAVMCLIITGIGTLIHLYSVSYMAEDESKPRFFSYLNLFLFSMLVLVLGANLPVLFIGWEGVGLCSYLLIGFWHTNGAYADAGKKAFIVNRIGDAGVLLAVFLLIQHFNTLDFLGLQQAVKLAGNQEELMSLIALGLFVGATGKSAQFPLFVWLPDAMAGPTPVSALIHAATMVTAGVYLMARMSFLFSMAPAVLALVGVIAIVTALIAALTALVQNDIKKVLAYSTVSQLGFMFLAASAGAYWVAIFHVMTHAFFKACLFLGAGSVIHGCHHEQDMREMGGLWKKMPVTFATYLISTLAIAGIFPLAGYHSKHAIIAALESSSNPHLGAFGHWIVVLASCTAFLTAFYMMRSVMMTFFGSYRGHAHPHESPPAMTFPLVVLAGLACVGGVYLEGWLPEYLKDVLSIAHHGGHHESIAESLMHSWIGFAGVGLAVVLYGVAKSVPAKCYSLVPAASKVLQGKFYLDEIYHLLIVAPLARFSQFCFRGVDQNVIDMSVNGTAWMVDLNGEMLRRTHSGSIRDYAMLMTVGTVCLVVFCLLM